MKKKPEREKPAEGSMARYDWAHATRGRLASKAARASALLRILDADLAARFPDSKSVNDALRALLGLESALPRRRGRRAA